MSLTSGMPGYDQAKTRIHMILDRPERGDRIAILGGFDVDRLCRSSETEIREQTGFLVRELGVDGGYALGSGNSIPDYVPIENYLIMLDQAWKLR